MSLRGLYDSQIAVYRANPSVSPLGAAVGTPEATGVVLRTTLQMPRLRQTEKGAGEMPMGYLSAYIDSGSGVLESDVLECISGPNAGRWYRVWTVYAVSKGRHLELTIQPYNGPRKPRVVTLNVDPSSATLDVNDTLQLTATLLDINNNVLSGRIIIWESLSPLIASVDPDGLVTALAEGAATIRATCEGVSDTCDITVNELVVAGSFSDSFFDPSFFV